MRQIVEHHFQLDSVLQLLPRPTEDPIHELPPQHRGVPLPGLPSFQKVSRVLRKEVVPR